jgi:glycosyltransferase involved in cell wall biosynthesis
MDVLLDAFKIFSREPHDFTLRIAGTGPDEKKLKSLAHSLGIAEKVKWLGNLPQNELLREYQKAKCFVLASLTEGFPKVIVEAMACGTPVIATKTGSCSEIVSDAGWIVACNAPDELARAMNCATRNDEIWKEKSAMSRKRAETISWENSAAIVQQVISRTLGICCEKSHFEDEPPDRLGKDGSLQNGVAPPKFKSVEAGEKIIQP